jgi:hypothetical protein
MGAWLATVFDDNCSKTPAYEREIAVISEVIVVISIRLLKMRQRLILPARTDKVANYQRGPGITTTRHTRLITI